MSNHRLRLRQIALAVLLFMGGGLMVAGVVLEQAAIAVAGAGAWVLVVIALLWGMRFRLDQASQTASGLREDIVRVRRSQLLMHGRVSTRLRDQRARFERIRDSQLKLHSRVALQGMAVTRKQESLIQQMRDLLEDSRQAGNDAQRLTLRAYRESHTEWTRVGTVLEQSLAAVVEERSQRLHSIKELEESISDGVRSIHEAGNGALEKVLEQLAQQAREQQRGAENVMEQLRLIVAEVEKSPDMLGSLAEDTGGRLGQVLASLAEMAGSIQGVRDGVQGVAERGDSIREELQRAVRSSGDGADRSAGMLEKTEAAVGGLGKAIAALEKSWTQGKAAIILKQQKSKREVSQTLEALSQLNKLVSLKAPYPLLDEWAMDPVSMLSLLREVLSRKPRLILECGSGTSTVWLAAALRRIGSGRLVSLDHLEEYAQPTRDALVAQGFEDIAEVRCAPLVQLEVADEAFKWYDPVTVSDLLEIDVLIVDGPPKGTGEQARYPALPLMANRLQAGALIVLDDTDRPEEGKIMERWQDSFAELGSQRAVGPRTTVMEWQARDRG